MGDKKELVPRVQLKDVERTILTIRGHKVILDADLSKLYGVSTKRLNEQVRRNRDRFPEDFMFQLTSEEKKEVVAICDHLSNLKFSAALPLAFTEHGALMAASVLNIPISHTGIYDRGLRQVIEADAGGVHATELSVFIEKSHRLIVIRPRWSTPPTT